MYYNKHANNVLFNYVTPNQRQQYYYQLPAQYYQPVQYIQQPVQYIKYQQPAQVQYPRPVQQYQGQYLQKPVYQKIQYKPVVRQIQAVQPNYFQYPQQNVKKMTKNEIDEINRTLSEVKMAMKQKRLRFAGDSKWLNNLQKIDDKGNFIMTSNPVKERPRTVLENQYYNTLAWNESYRETAEAQQLKKEKYDKLPLSQSIIERDINGKQYKAIRTIKPHTVNYYYNPNAIQNNPATKYIYCNGAYYQYR